MATRSSSNNNFPSISSRSRSYSAYRSKIARAPMTTNPTTKTTKHAIATATSAVPTAGTNPSSRYQTNQQEEQVAPRPPQNTMKTTSTDTTTDIHRQHQHQVERMRIIQAMSDRLETGLNEAALSAIADLLLAGAHPDAVVAVASSLSQR